MKGSFLASLAITRSNLTVVFRGRPPPTRFETVPRSLQLAMTRWTVVFATRNRLLRSPNDNSGFAMWASTILCFRSSDNLGLGGIVDQMSEWTDDWTRGSFRIYTRSPWDFSRFLDRDFSMSFRQAKIELMLNFYSWDFDKTHLRSWLGVPTKFDNFSGWTTKCFQWSNCQFIQTSHWQCLPSQCR